MKINYPYSDFAKREHLRSSFKTIRELTFWAGDKRNVLIKDIEDSYLNNIIKLIKRCEMTPESLRIRCLETMELEKIYRNEKRSR